VEAFYRGEHASAKAKGIRRPSHYAEDVVAQALAISAPSVHMICGRIRRMRKECGESANFPAMTLSDFKKWMETGDDGFRTKHLSH